MSFPATRKIFFTFFSAESGFARKTCAAERSVSGKGKYHHHPPEKGGEKTETNPRDYGERCRFDAFCKTVLKHEAIDFIREMKRWASRETSLERLPQAAMDKLCSADDYPSDSYVFSYCGYNLPIRSHQVADGFAGLPEQAQSILILRLVLDLTDSEIDEALGLSRSALQRRRTKSLNVLRAKLTARKGGYTYKVPELQGP